MDKLKYHITNALLSSIIGVFIYFGQDIVFGFSRFSLYYLFYNMVISSIIGTISIFTAVKVMTIFRNNLRVALISNFMVITCVIGMMVLAAWIGNSDIDSLRWFIIWSIAQILSFFLAVKWYREIQKYNRVLQLKKEDLKNGDEV